MAVLPQIWLYEINWSMLLMCQNTTMWVYGAWIKKILRFMFKNIYHLGTTVVVITSLLVRDKPLGSPASVKRVYFFRMMYLSWWFSRSPCNDSMPCKTWRLAKILEAPIPPPDQDLAHFCIFIGWHIFYTIHFDFSWSCKQWWLILRCILSNKWNRFLKTKLFENVY